MTYEKRLEILMLVCDHLGVNVKFVSRNTLKDYGGMNSEAARQLGFKMPKNTIYIREDSNLRDTYLTLAHELNEMQLMKEYAMPYWKAHMKSLNLEKNILRRS